MNATTSFKISPTDCRFDKTAVIGGGLTGLTLGYFLGSVGKPFEILEKENECGGLMRTLHENGFSFDYGGSHIIFSKNKEILEFMLNLLGNNVVRNIRNTKILYEDRQVKYPFENGLADLSKQANFECIYSFIQTLIGKETGQLKKPNNMKEWFYYTFGKGITENYLVPYNQKIWKYPLDRMALDWVERIPTPPVADIIKSSLGIETEGYTHQLFFYYPKTGGIETIIKSLEKNFVTCITPNYEVKTIRKEDGKWFVSNKKHEKSFDRIVSTIPIQVLVDAIDSPSDVKTAANNLRYNSLITIMLAVNKSDVNNLSWLYVPDPNIIFHRVSFPSNFSPCVSPPGKSAVVAEITCLFGDETWRMSDEELAGRVIGEMHQLGIIKESDVSFLRVKRAKYAYVISDLDCRENLQKVKDYLDQIDVGFVGRFAEFKYYNMDDCIKSARDYVFGSKK
jgi:protoporphyrinogen oxidase